MTSRIRRTSRSVARFELRPIRRAVLAVALGLSIIASGLPASGLAWDFPNAQTAAPGSAYVAINEPSTFDAWSQWGAYGKWGTELEGSSHLCPTGIDTANCDPAKYDVNLTSILSVCQNQADSNCVEGLSFEVSGSGVVEASFVRGVNGYDYEAPEQGAIPAGEISLWNAPGVIHGGNDSSYAVLIRVNQHYDINTKKFKTTGITANVTPYTATPGASGSMPEHSENVTNGVTTIGTRHDPSCIWADEIGCGHAEDFPADVKVTLVIRFSSEVAGWFRGRLKDPVMELEAIDSQTSRLQVTAEPVTVPRILVTATAENTPENVKKILEKTGGKNNANGPLFQGNAIEDFFANQGSFVFEVIDGLRAAAEDSAAGISTLWNFSSIDGYDSKGCFADKSKLYGIVTTNASAYEGNPPQFRDGTLNYQVAGYHYAPDGVTPNLGTYDLIMDSSTARCLYGFTNAPISATVAVVGTGDQNIATTIVSEKNGWLKLAAYGFTFSEKEIQVKVTQPQNKTLTRFSGSTRTLTSKQKTEVKSIVNKAKGNPKFICTGVYVNAKDKLTALKRARAACDYAKSLDKDHSYWAQAKQSKAKSYDAKVMIVSK